MKSIKLFIVLLSISIFSSCGDTEDYIVINEDNSGTYTHIMDLSKMIGMINQMGGENNANRKLEKLDSIINLKELVSNATNLTASEKELYKEATMRIKLDKVNDEMKIIMHCPFKSISQLPEIVDNFSIVLNKINAFGKMAGEEEAPGLVVDEESAKKSLTPTAVYFKFTAEPGVIQNRLIDGEGIKNALKSDSTFMAMQQMVALFGAPTYKTTITTTKDIKSYTGNRAMLAANKKSVTFSSTFAEVLEYPEKTAYKVEY